MIFFCLLASIVVLCTVTPSALAQSEPARTELETSGPQDSAEPSPRESYLEAAYQFALAKLLVEESSFQEAQEAFEQALSLDNSDPYSYLEVAKFHYELAFISRTAERRRQQLLRAAEHAEDAVRLAPENTEILFQYAQVHFRLGEHQISSLNRAQETLEKLRALRPGDVQVLMPLGQIYFMKRQPDKAADVLKEATSYLPNHRMVQSMFVEALVESGRLEELDSALAKLIELDPANLEERLRLYELRRDKNDYRGAARALRTAPPEIQSDLRLRRALAHSLHVTGENDEALGLVDGLLAESPDDQGLPRLRVSILNSLARYSEAIEALRPLVDSGEDPARKLQDAVLLNRLLERVGRGDEALSHLRSLSEANGSSLQLHLTLIDALERYERSDEAIELLENKLKTAGAEEAGVYGPALSDLLERGGRVDEALAVLDETAAGLRRANKPEGLVALDFRRLSILASHERWQDLVDWAPTLLEHENADLRSAARRLQAEGLAALGQVDEALQLLDPGAGEGGENRRTLTAQIEVLFDHDREEDALKLLSDMAERGGVEDLYRAAQLYQRQELYDSVVKLTERLLTERPESIQALFLLGAAEERRGAREASIATFQRLLEIEPDHAPTLNYLGYMWAEQGENLQESLKLILRAVSLDPDSGAYVDSLGWVYYQLGRYDQALIHLEWAARLLPTDPTIFEHLGDLYLKLEEEARARDSYQQALDLGGENLDRVKGKLESLGGKGP